MEDTNKKIEQDQLMDFLLVVTTSTISSRLASDTKSYDQFVNNLEGLESKDPGMYLQDKKFHLYNYVRFYCKIDVEVLRDGLITFKDDWLPELNKMVKKLNKSATPVYFNNILTCSNLAKQLYIAAGCFDGCYQIKGLVRKFIEKCVVG